MDDVFLLDGFVVVSSNNTVFCVDTSRLVMKLLLHFLLIWPIRSIVEVLTAHPPPLLSTAVAIAFIVVHIVITVIVVVVKVIT